MTKHTLYKPTWEEVQIEVPDACPKCGADTTAPGALQVWDWACQLCTLNEDGALEPDGCTDFENTFTESIRCRRCSHEM